MPDPGPQKPATQRFGLIVLALAAVLGGFTLWRATSVAPPALVGGPFALLGGDGKTVTDKDFLGHPFLVYFGYTHCPDICPTELARIGAVFERLPGKPLKGAFITIDPDRDTPALVADYVSSFDKRIVGLSGSPEAVAAAEKAYKVYARKGEAKPDGSYGMDHTSVVYLMDAKGGFAEAFNLDRPPEEAAAELATYF